MVRDPDSRLLKRCGGVVGVLRRRRNPCLPSAPASSGRGGTKPRWILPRFVPSRGGPRRDVRVSQLLYADRVAVLGSEGRRCLPAVCPWPHRGGHRFVGSGSSDWTPDPHGGRALGPRQRGGVGAPN